MAKAEDLDSTQAKLEALERLREEALHAGQVAIRDDQLRDLLAAGQVVGESRPDLARPTEDDDSHQR